MDNISLLNLPIFDLLKHGTIILISIINMGVKNKILRKLWGISFTINVVDLNNYSHFYFYTATAAAAAANGPIPNTIPIATANEPATDESQLWPAFQRSAI